MADDGDGVIRSDDNVVCLERNVTNNQIPLHDKVDEIKAFVAWLTRKEWSPSDTF